MDRFDASKCGLSSAHLEILNRCIVDRLKDLGARVWLFGSRARGDFTPTSDVDLMFEPENAQSLPSGFLFKVKNKLEESRFPFTLDLVAVRDLAESYRQSAMAERVEL